MKVWLFAVILAAIITPSGILGSSYYLAGAQQQSSVQTTTTATTTIIMPPSIQANTTAVTAGHSVLVSGNNFTKNTQVSLSFDKVLASAQLTNGSAIVVQGNNLQTGSSLQQTSTTAAASNNNQGGDAFGILGFFQGLFGLGKNSNTSSSGTTAVTSTTSTVFFAVQSSSTGGSNNATLTCNGKPVAQLTLAATGAASVAPANLTSGSTYSDCSVNVSGQSVNLSQFTVPSTQNSTATTSASNVQAKVAADGKFNATIAVPADASGNYAIFAVGNQDVAFTQVTINAAASTSGTPVSNNVPPSGSSNATTPSSTNGTTASANANQTSSGQFTFSPSTTTNTANGSASNSSSSTTSASSGQAQVSLSSSNVEQGAPLSIAGQGFKPQTPIQIFINNIQVTNIITNIQGSFNSVVIVPTTVNAGSAKVEVKTEQTTVNQQVTVVKPTPESLGPATVTFTAVSTSGGTLTGAPVTIFDASRGQLVESGKTPLTLQLKRGTYSVFYSAFDGNTFVSASPGAWAKAGDDGAGVITVRGGTTLTVIATYQQQTVVPPPPPQPALSSLTLKAVDTSGNPINGMFVTVYSADNGKKIQQGFTEMTVSSLPPGTYPIFFANFGAATFASASPGTWVQTPYGGAGLVTIPNDGVSHSITVTAVYQVSQTTVASFAIQAPLNIGGTIFSITSNQTNPQGPFINSGVFHLKVDNESPVQASFSASLVSARSDLNNNVMLNSQQSRAHSTFQIDNLKATFAHPVGPDTYVIVGTADVLMDGTMYSAAEPVQITVTGGSDLAPTGVQIAFQGDGGQSAAARFETLYGAVDIGLK